MTGEDTTDAGSDERIQRFDPDSFGPADFEAMSEAEWIEAFDPDTWVTGDDLLDRVERELHDRVARRDVFAVIERITHDGERCVLAYSDEGYALIRPSGEVEGFGSVLRDVKPTVALCSIPEYEPDPIEPGVGSLPDPTDVTTGQGALGNTMLQLIALSLVVGGFALVGGWLFLDVPLLGGFIGLGFLIVAGFLLFTVANARLSERYRAEEYRDRLRSVGLGHGERPGFVPADETGINDDESAEG